MLNSRWQAGTALYILGLIGYQGALTFWTAAFPGLARDLPIVQESEKKLATGETEYVCVPDIAGEVLIGSQATHDKLDMIQRNRLANVSFFVCSMGGLVILAVLAGILKGIINDSDPNSNTRALSVVCAYSAGVWSESHLVPRVAELIKVLCAIPWLIWEQYRPGNQLPPHTTYLTVG